jgi:hypothetical protein
MGVYYASNQPLVLQHGVSGVTDSSLGPYYPEVCVTARKTEEKQMRIVHLRDRAGIICR